MRKTKIVCTIGPASDGEDVMEKMCKAGMNVARLNFSHGTHDDYEKKIENRRRASTNAVTDLVKVIRSSPGSGLRFCHPQLPAICDWA